MSNVYEEHNKGIEFLIKTYNDLKIMNRKHELLDFIIVKEANQFEVTDKFNKIYVNQSRSELFEDKVGGQSIRDNLAMEKYRTDLEKAIRTELDLFINKKPDMTNILRIYRMYR